MGSIYAINGNDRNFFRNRYIMSFAGQNYMVWANSIDDATDELIDYVSEDRPNLLCDKQVFAKFEELRFNGVSENEAYEQSSEGMVCGGNCGNYIESQYFDIVLTNPTREEIKNIQKMSFF